jgi:hypothetical protein
MILLDKQVKLLEVRYRFCSLSVLSCVCFPMSVFVGADPVPITGGANGRMSLSRLGETAHAAIGGVLFLIGS